MVVIAENDEKEIERLSVGLTEGDRVIAQLNAVTNLLVDKGLVSSEEYLKEFIESLKETRELKKKS